MSFLSLSKAKNGLQSTAVTVEGSNYGGGCINATMNGFSVYFPTANTIYDKISGSALQGKTNLIVSILICFLH